MLAYFASRPGRALARNEILNAVWGSLAMVTPRSIDRCVTTLRAKIETDPARSLFYPHHPRYRIPVRNREGLAHRLLNE